MEFNCTDCKHFLNCSAYVSSLGCDFFENLNSCIRKKYVLVHHYMETGKFSIVSFSDSYDDLMDVASSHSRFRSSRHCFTIVSNSSLSVVAIDGRFCRTLDSIKEESLLSICKNVAEYLSIAEYAMLKKSYFKASAWFEKAKNSAAFADDILVNY